MQIVWILLAVCQSGGAAAAAIVEITRAHKKLCRGCCCYERLLVIGQRHLHQVHTRISACPSFPFFFYEYVQSFPHFVCERIKRKMTGKIIKHGRGR